MKKLSIILVVLLLIWGNVYFFGKYEAEKSKNEVFLKNALNESAEIFGSLDESFSEAEALKGIYNFNAVSRLFLIENKEYKNHFDGICQRMLIDTDLAKEYSAELYEIAELLKNDESNASVKISELFNKITLR